MNAGVPTSRQPDTGGTILPRVAGVRTRPLKERAQRAVRPSGPPTHPITVGVRDDAVDETVARAVLDLALRVGEAMLSTGASASDVTATVLRLAAAYGLRSCHVDVTFTSITVSYHRGPDDDPMTVLRIVRVRTTDWARLGNLQTLVRDAAGGMDIAEARDRLDRIVAAPHPYRRWVVTFALASLAASVAALLGGDWRVMAISAATTALVDRVQRRLGQWGLPAFFSQAVSAAVPTTVAVLLLWLRSALDSGDDPLQPGLVVASGVVVLLAGLSVVGAAQDAIDGYYVTAGARTFEVLLLTLGIVVGIGLVLDVARRAGVPLTISGDAGLSSSLAVQVSAAAAVAGFFAASSYARPRTALVAALAGGLGWVVLAGAGLAGLEPAVGSALAAFVVGSLAQVLSDRVRVPALAVSVAGIVPLLPGLAVYRAMFQLVEPGLGRSDLWLTTLVGAAGIGLGLAAGVSLGTFAARPLRTELDRWQRRALRRAAGSVDTT